MTFKQKTRTEVDFFVLFSSVNAICQISRLSYAEESFLHSDNHYMTVRKRVNL